MTILRKLIWCVGLLFTAASCGSDRENPQPLIPNVYVNEQLNLTSIANAPLQRDGGFVYIKGGVRGIIVYRQTTNVYYAYERNCPYQPFDDCATVSVDQSQLFLIDTCCNSQFNFSGYPIGGPSQVPLKRYRTSVSGNLLYISN